jgi:protocatechuate 3,4-dioxygenase beta subunit
MSNCSHESVGSTIAATIPQPLKSPHRRLSTTATILIVAVLHTPLFYACYLILRPVRETDEMRITWTGLNPRNSGIVEGRVVDSQGRPLAGIAVDPVTDSGGNYTQADLNGKFRAEVSGQLVEIQVKNGESWIGCNLVRIWDPTSWLGIRTGIRMEIVVKDQ